MQLGTTLNFQSACHSFWSAEFRSVLYCARLWLLKSDSLSALELSSLTICEFLNVHWFFRAEVQVSLPCSFLPSCCLVQIHTVSNFKLPFFQVDPFLSSVMSVNSFVWSLFLKSSWLFLGSPWSNGLELSHRVTIQSCVLFHASFLQG